MSFFKKIEKKLRDVKDKIVDDIIPNELKSGAKAKESLRNLIPNELADVAVKAAPFVAMIPGGAPYAAAMRGIGRFDQRGSISDALKQAAATAAFSTIATPFTSQLPGLSGNTYEGLSGVLQAGKDLGSSAYSGIKSLGTSGKNKALDILGKGSVGDMYPTDYGYELGSGGGGIKSLGSKILDYGKEFAFGDDKKFQMGDIGRFLGDPGKTVPLTMIASYIKEKFFPDEDQDSFDAKFAEAMQKRGENVEGYLRQYGPFDPRRDPTENPYTQEEIDQFAKDKTIEYRNVAASGGLMTLPRENYFLGSKKAFTVNPNPDFERASEVTPDDILNVFKAKFDGGDFFGRRSPRLALPMGQPLYVGKSPIELKESKVSSDDIMNVFKKKFDEGNFFGRRSPRLALPMGQVSATFSPKQRKERAFDVNETGREIYDRKGLGKLMASLLRQANFDREEAAMGGRMNYASGSEGIMMASNPDPMDERDQVLEMMAMQEFGKPLRDLTDDQIIELEEMFDDFVRSGQPLPSDPTKPINPFAPKPTGPALPMKADLDDVRDSYSELMFGKPVEALTPDELEEFELLFEMEYYGKKETEPRMMAQTGGRVNYAFGTDTPEENAMQAAGIEGLDININPKGITELDMRETGGFIPPVGVKEKEDDIPAMLSNNEFVFTADAVKGMGDGDVNKGAERMYSMMKKLENGGRV